MTSHTPGPWHYESDGVLIEDPAAFKSPGYYDNIHLVGADGQEVAGNDEYDTITPQNRALIAAAPDLLEALKALNHSWENGCQPPVRMWDAARAAIAQAEGRSNE